MIRDRESAGWKGNRVSSPATVDDVDCTRGRSQCPDLTRMASGGRSSATRAFSSHDAALQHSASRGRPPAGVLLFFRKLLVSFFFRRSPVEPWCGELLRGRGAYGSRGSRQRTPSRQAAGSATSEHGSGATRRFTTARRKRGWVHGRVGS